MDLSRKAAELRKQIIDVCSRNGGHIGASLGAVELTLALHLEFQTPRDSIVWDVGHQSYAHKLLTGRQASFDRLRKRGGPSGFTSREESLHDVFGAGHSSTSISAAIGIAEAKRIKKDESWTVAIIGDGGLTAGLAFEALNQAGASEQPRLVIVVNDNNLSISKNVGALDRWAFGAEREPRKFFESLGFDYAGPFDGHDIERMRIEFQRVKSRGAGQVSVIHILTKKGKGFTPAENEPVRFHGVGPFDKVTGKVESKSTTPTYSALFGKELVRLAEVDSRIVAITAAMAEGTGLVEFSGRFPDRFYDVGIAEPHALVFAGGLATQGIKPVIAIYSTFLQRGVDSLIHDLALQNLDVTLAVDRAGLVGADGPTHHGAFDIPILRTVPNVSICAPSTSEDLSYMLTESLSRGGVKAIRYPRGSAPMAHESWRPLGWGKAWIARQSVKPRETQVVVWGLGNAFNWAQAAVESLDEAIREYITLVDARFVKPIDLDRLRTTGAGVRALVTLEDGSIAGGFGAAVMEAFFQSEIALPAKIQVLGIGDSWVRHGEVPEQRAELGLSKEQIAATLKELVRP